MDLIEVQRPAWCLIAIAGTWVYALVILFVVGRANDARLMVAFPIVADVAVGAYAGFEVLWAISLAGGSLGPAIRAATVAEALIPVFHGAVAGMILSSVVQFSNRLTEVRRRTTHAGSVALAVGLPMFAAWIVVMWLTIRVSPATAAELAYIALFLCAAAAILGLAMLVIAVGDIVPSGEKYSRWWFLSFAVLLAAVAVSLWTAEYRLYAFAARGGT